MPDWWKIKNGGSMPLGEWRRITPLLTVQGVQFRRAEAIAFAKTALKLHAQRGQFGLLIEPEPENPHDTNALRIVGWGRGVSRHIGYVEAPEASRVAVRHPGAMLAAEFYSLYLSAGGYIDIRYFLSAPADCKAVASERVRTLLELTRDELTILCYAARADNKLGRLEADILSRYCHERARDWRISLVDQDVSDIKRWCKEHMPTAEDARAAIHHLADTPEFSPVELWELIEVVLGIDGKLSKTEIAVAKQIASFIKEAVT